MRRCSLLLSLLLVLPVACARTPQALRADATPAQRALAAADLVDVATLAPGIVIDMRYAGRNNFVGAPVDGYRANRCYLHTAAAQALARVQAAVAKDGWRLHVFDCYRPECAVRHFMRWVADTADQRTRADYYPRLDKAALKGDYIAESSGHSRGYTIDLTLERCDGGICTPLDMGTTFDLFDVRANTAHADLTVDQKENRQRLLQSMAAEGFANYPLEWWHYSHRPEPEPKRAFDIPVE